MGDLGLPLSLRLMPVCGPTRSPAYGGAVPASVIARCGLSVLAPLLVAFKWIEVQCNQRRLIQVRLLIGPPIGVSVTSHRTSHRLMPLIPSGQPSGGFGPAIGRNVSAPNLPIGVPNGESTALPMGSCRFS